MDSYYYLSAQNEQKGPVPAEELLNYGVGRATLVWKEGMSQWKPAGEIPELGFLFQSGGPTPPPPYSGGQPGQPGGQGMGYVRVTPDSFLVWSILSTVLCCLPLGIVAIVYSSKVDGLWSQGLYDEAEKASKNAKLFCLIGAGSGLLVGLIYFCILIFAGMMGV